MEGIKKHTVFCRITDGAVKKIRRFRNNTKGVTTVEVILVLVVLLAIVVIFREQLTAIVTGIFSHVNSSQYNCIFIAAACTIYWIYYDDDRACEDIWTSSAPSLCYRLCNGFIIFYV